MSGPDHDHRLDQLDAAAPEIRTPLLSPGDPEPLIVQNPGGRSGFVLVCDHAGRAIPRRLGTLGLTAPDLERHIAWDIGAAGLARKLGEALDACVLLQAYSRLVADCNRTPGLSGMAPAVSDGTAIPGNAGLSAEDLRDRVEAIHAPYHAGIAAALDARQASLKSIAVVSVHSFTPVMDGLSRPWSVGVLHADDSPLSHALLRRLQAQAGLCVGDNQPYSLGDIDYTIPRHAQGRGLDYLELEVRQDLIADDAGQAAIAALLARLLEGLDPLRTSA